MEDIRAELSQFRRIGAHIRVEARLDLLRHHLQNAPAIITAQSRVVTPPTVPTHREAGVSTHRGLLAEVKEEEGEQVAVVRLAQAKVEGRRGDGDFERQAQGVGDGL